VSFDVLEEAQFWFTKSNTICDPGPEVSFVFFSLSLSCCREWLAVVDDGSVGVVTFVFFNGDVVDIGNATWLVAPDILPSVISFNLSRSISVRNDKEILIPLIDSSAFNLLCSGGFVFSDARNHSKSSLSEEGERYSQTSADRCDSPVAAGVFFSVSVSAEIPFAQRLCSFWVESKHPSRQMLLGSSRAKLFAELVEFFFDDGKSSGSSF
jgi:hypothetical protein